jgi:hypothetical protein
MGHRWRIFLGIAALLSWASAATAGMPAPLPTNPEQILRLNETPLARLQAISFFLLGLLLCAAAVWGLWNYLQHDFPKLPRLSFVKALAGVVLWGLVFVIVLTMISGARELMTPGAWNKQGFTYKLSPDAVPTVGDSPAALRHHSMEQLRTELWHFAATHNGRFPSQQELAIIPPHLWEVPETGGMNFLYIPDKSADQTATPLAYEPELDPDQRIVLQTNGQIVTLSSTELRYLLAKGERP